MRECLNGHARLSFFNLVAIESIAHLLTIAGRNLIIDHVSSACIHISHVVCE